MWIFTAIGFFSVVQKPGDVLLTIRARVADDLDRLRADYLPTLSATVQGAGNDYPYRAVIGHDDFARGLAKLARDVDYPNFKDEVAATMGHERAAVYNEVWYTLLTLEEGVLSHSAQFPALHRAYGGVVIDDAGQVLLREPRGHFGGYHWTFAKGRPLPGEEAAETALRETREEMGVSAEVVEELPDIYPGTTTDSSYFLLSPVEVTGEWDEETSDIRWATREEAARLIAQTSTSVGRDRDLRVLDAAFALHDARHAHRAEPRLVSPPHDGQAVAQAGGTATTAPEAIGVTAAPAPLLDVVVSGRAAVLTDPKSVADAWKWAVARAAGEAWRGGYITEDCALRLNFDLAPARFRDTALVVHPVEA